jgi:hypothetical protein
MPVGQSWNLYSTAACDALAKDIVSKLKDSEELQA